MATLEQLLADIARVEAARSNPASMAYMNKNYGGIDNYIASQQARINALTPSSPSSSTSPAKSSSGVTPGSALPQPTVTGSGAYVPYDNTTGTSAYWRFQTSGGNVINATDGGMGHDYALSRAQKYAPSSLGTPQPAPEGHGYAYIDKYGFPHVTHDLRIAQTYAAPGTQTYLYEGSYGGGYALDKHGNRAMLNLPGARSFGNQQYYNPAQGSIVRQLSSPSNGMINNPFTGASLNYTPSPGGRYSDGYSGGYSGSYGVPINWDDLFNQSLGRYTSVMENAMAKALANERQRNEERFGGSFAGIQAKLEKDAQQEVVNHYTRLAMQDAFQKAGLNAQHQNMLFDFMDRDRRHALDTRRVDLDEFSRNAPFYRMTATEIAKLAQWIVNTFPEAGLTAQEVINWIHSQTM